MLTVNQTNYGLFVESEQVLAACRRLAGAIDGFEVAAARELGVNRTDLRALNLLEEGPLGQVAITATLGITRASVTALVDRLEKSGYVRRLADLDDRRVTLAGLMPATWGAFAQVYRPAGERVLAVADEWSDVERRIVAQAFDALAGSFVDHSRSQPPASCAGLATDSGPLLSLVRRTRERNLTWLQRTSASPQLHASMRVTHTSCIVGLISSGEIASPCADSDALLACSTLSSHRLIAAPLMRPFGD